jgi:hypothetical protein
MSVISFSLWKVLMTKGIFDEGKKERTTHLLVGKLPSIALASAYFERVHSMHIYARAWKKKLFFEIALGKNLALQRLKWSSPLPGTDEPALLYQMHMHVHRDGSIGG